MEKATLYYIVRDHDLDLLREKTAFMETAANYMKAKYGNQAVELSIKESYYNMRSKIEPCMYIVDRAAAAMEQVGITPKVVPIRGGTDGARLSFEGLPCPNLCTGGENFHGRFEYIPVEDMEKVVELLVQILRTAN